MTRGARLAVVCAQLTLVHVCHTDQAGGQGPEGWQAPARTSPR